MKRMKRSPCKRWCNGKLEDINESFLASQLYPRHSTWDCHICPHCSGFGGQCRHIGQSHVSCLGIASISPSVPQWEPLGFLEVGSRMEPTIVVHQIGLAGLEVPVLPRFSRLHMRTAPHRSDGQRCPTCGKVVQTCSNHKIPPGSSGGIEGVSL